LAGCTSAKAYDEALVTAGDGTVLRGRIYGSGPTAVVMVHEYDSDQKVWEPLATTLADRGYMVLTYDMRGHGESPGVKEVGMAAGDAASAVRYLRRQAQRTHIFLIGEGLGATAVLKAATQEQVLGVVSISGHQEFRGLRVVDDIPRIVAPKLFIASEGDSAGSEAARAFQEKAKQPSILTIVPGAERGAGIRAGDAGQQTRQAITDFLTEHKKV
jgi:pimeloyl-ACP methyl ester carboxylesterase